MQHVQHRHLALDQGRGADRQAARLAQRAHRRANGVDDAEAVTHRLAQHQHFDANLVALGARVLAGVAAAHQGAQVAVGAGLGDAERIGHVGDATRLAGGGQQLEQAQDQIDRIEVHRRRGSGFEGVEQGLFLVFH